MTRQKVPLRTGWFGYRKLDVENCIAHLDAVCAAERRLAQQAQQGLEGIMTQMEQENHVLRQRYVQQTAAQASATAQAESARAQAEQLSRKLAAARAEVRRYQTRMFAFERTFLALKHENAELESACEQAREEAEQANLRAEQAEKALQEAQQALTALQASMPEPAAEPVEEAQELPEPESEPQAEAKEVAEVTACSALPELAALPQEPAWQPKTELEHLSVELMDWFDAMMAET